MCQRYSNYMALSYASIVIDDGPPLNLIIFPSCPLSTSGRDSEFTCLQSGLERLVAIPPFMGIRLYGGLMMPYVCLPSQQPPQPLSIARRLESSLSRRFLAMYLHKMISGLKIGTNHTWQDLNHTLQTSWTFFKVSAVPHCQALQLG